MISNEIPKVHLDALLTLLSSEQQDVVQRQLARHEVDGVVVYGSSPEDIGLLVTPFGPGCANKELSAFEGSFIKISGAAKYPVVAYTKDTYENYPRASI